MNEDEEHVIHKIGDMLCHEVVTDSSDEVQVEHLQHEVRMFHRLPA